MCNIYIYYSIKSYNNEDPEVTIRGEIIKNTGHNVVIRDGDGYEQIIPMYNIVAIVYDENYIETSYELKPVYVYYSAKAYDHSKPEIEFNGKVQTINENNIVVTGEQGLMHIISTFPIIAFVHQGGTHYEVK